MKILIDKYIPFIQGLLEEYFQVEYLSPEEFSPDRVKDADALIVRTRTRCNCELLHQSRVQLIATATIGYDHIDTDYCHQAGIKWFNSAGCNAAGVSQYVEAAIEELERHGLIQGNSIGIIGVGNVGKLVAQMAQNRGYRVLVNDPPLERVNKQILMSYGQISSIEEITQQADIITFHTPLTKTANDRTYHLCDTNFLQACKPKAVIINAARGGILDEEAMLQENNKEKTFVIDTWEGEPKINKQVLERCFIGTYHIAGYTRQGKINATNMCLQAVCQHFCLPKIEVNTHTLTPNQTLNKHWIREVDKQLRSNVDDFELLRETYKLR